MSNATQSQEAAQTGTPSVDGMRGEIEQKWSKFTHQEISALKDNADLVAQLQTKYSLDEDQARKQVDAFANGRQL